MAARTPGFWRTVDDLTRCRSLLLVRPLPRAGREHARILEVNQTLLLDFAVPLYQQWQPLLIISGIHDMPDDVDGETVQYHLSWQPTNPASITCSIAAARENAGIIREVISAETWERLNYYYLGCRATSAITLRERPQRPSTARSSASTLDHGNQRGDDVARRSLGFFPLGKYLERACQTARILDVKYHILLPTVDVVGTPVDNAHWVAIS